MLAHATFVARVLVSTWIELHIGKCLINKARKFKIYGTDRLGWFIALIKIWIVLQEKKIHNTSIAFYCIYYGFVHVLLTVYRLVRSLHLITTIKFTEN